MDEVNLVDVAVEADPEGAVEGADEEDQAAREGVVVVVVVAMAVLHARGLGRTRIKRAEATIIGSGAMIKRWLEREGRVSARLQIVWSGNKYTRQLYMMGVHDCGYGCN